MTVPSAFLTHGLAAAQRALASVAELTQAHLNPNTLGRTLAQRARAELARLEIIIRRLLTLMALAIELAPVKPRSVTSGTPKSDAAEPICRKSVPGFSLTAKVLSAFDPDASGLLPCTIRASGPVPAAPILARLAVLQLLLAAPDAHARRLARTLARQRRAGEAAPIALPMARTHRMPPELGAIATSLPDMLRAAFKSWESSG
jgi:hypothetical protein